MPERPDFVFSGVNHGPEHGRGRAVLGHRLGGDGGGDARRAGHRASRSRAASPRRWPRIATCWSRPGAAGSRRVPDFPASRRCSTSTFRRVPATRGHGAPGDEARQPLLLRVAHADEGPLGPGDLLDRRRHASPGPGRRHSDHRRWHEGYISVTPLHMDLTNYCSSRRCGDGRWRGRGGRRLRRLPHPAGGDAAAEGHPRPRACCGPCRLVPRHLFVPESVRHRAYEDAALPIGSGQTISQPWVQARYLELLRLTGKERVLEIGTGSGYQTALLAMLGRPRCSASSGCRSWRSAAQKALAASSASSNVTILVGDGTLGWRPFAPYDAILVAAASPDIPEPLVEQLAPGGRLVIPLGDRRQPGPAPGHAPRRGPVRHHHARRRALRAALGEFGFRT